MLTTADSNTTVPLTASQKLWLSTKFLPVTFFAVIFIFMLTALPTILHQSVPPLLLIFCLLVMLVVIYEASKALRDLISGVALVEADQLEDISHTRQGSRGNRRYGNFTRLGKMQLSGQAYHNANVGQHYRVTYSPATRMVWSLDVE